MRNEKGHFLKGNLPLNSFPKGTVRARKHIHTKGKNKGKTDIDWYINIDWKGNRKHDYNYKKWLWETHNQKDLPKGYIVYNNGDSKKKPLYENLELITRAELLARNHFGYKKKGD